MLANTNLELIWFKQILANQDLVSNLENITLIITDVDGCLTDANIDYTCDQEFSRRFSIQDGFAIEQALKAGLLVGFMSGKAHSSSNMRAQKLGIPEDLNLGGKKDKVVALKTICESRNINMQNILFFGDDCYDARVKLAVPEIIFATPSNAPFYYQNIANIVLPKQGGQHVFRLLLDLVLYVQKKHFSQELIDRLVR
ncbi:MAG: hypothetical protein ABH827_00295 [bacterium]